MTVPSTADFKPSLDTINERAWSRVRRVTGQPQSGDTLDSSLECWHLLLQDLTVRAGANLWTIEQVTQSLTAGDVDYVLAQDTDDILEVMIYDSALPSQ